MKKKRTLTQLLILVFFLTMTITTIISIVFFRMDINNFEELKGYINSEEISRYELENKIGEMVGHVKIVEVYALISGLVIGIVLVTATSKKIITPIKNLSKATEEVSKGNYDINLSTHVNDEIGELTQNFNKMANTLKNVEYLQKDFMSNVSHEFKTPVTAIEGFVHLLKDENITEEERKEYLEIIGEETKRLSNLSTNVLKLSKLENEDFKLNLEEYELAEQIRKSILLLESKWSKKKIDLILNLKDVHIIADKDLLQQVWINIIGNAIKFSNEKGKIAVTLKKAENDYAIIEVKDNGIGIPKDKQERIFERFYQANTSHSKEGNGLGLAICKKIIYLHSGIIEFESIEGKRTTFKIKIPINL